MTINNGPAPDASAAAFALQMDIKQRGGEKPGFLFGIFPLECNVSGPFSLQAASPFSKNIPCLFSSGSGGKTGGKFLDAIASIPNDLKEKLKNAEVLYSGDTPSGSVHSGGSFAANIGASSGPDYNSIG